MFQSPFQMKQVYNGSYEKKSDGKCQQLSQPIGRDYHSAAWAPSGHMMNYLLNTWPYIGRARGPG